MLMKHLSGKWKSAGLTALLAALVLTFAFFGCSRTSTLGLGGGGLGFQGTGTSWNNEPGGDLLWSVKYLNRMLDSDEEIVLIDCRFDEADFDTGHIEDAIWLTWKQISPDPAVGFLPQADVAAFLGNRGIERTDKIVIYNDGVHYAQNPCRLFWLLEYYGCDDVHVVDGGLRAWEEAGFPVDNTPWSSYNITPKTFTAVINDLIVADTAYVRNIVDNFDTTTTAILDARSQEEFNGEIDPVQQDLAGHIPLSGHVWWSWCVDHDTGLLRTPKQIKNLFGPAGAVPGKEIIAVGLTGVRSTLDYFVCRLLGYPCRVYQEGILTWTDVDVPTQNPVERTGAYIHKSVCERLFAGASTVFGGKVFLFGGIRHDVSNNTYNIVDWIQRFDPTVMPVHEGSDTTAWTVLNAPMSVPRSYMGAAADLEVGADAIYLFGGRDPSGTVHSDIIKCDVDPNTLNITGMTTLGVSLPEPLLVAGCVFNDDDGLIYIFGGSNTLSATGATASTYVFTPESQGGPAINVLDPLPSARSRCGGVALDGKIYCLGGETADMELLDEVLVLEPGGSKSGWTEIEPMLIPRLGVKGAVAFGRIYMCGGFIDDPEYGYSTAGKVESFDPSMPDDGWRDDGKMAMKKYQHYMESVDNVIYLFGGYKGPPHTMAGTMKDPNVVEFRPVISELKTPILDGAQHGGATAVINDKIYIFGGYEDGSLTSKVKEYDPAADTWTLMDPMPNGAHKGASAVVSGGKAIVFDGAFSTATLEFDPSQPLESQWTTLEAMPDDRYGAAAVYYDDTANMFFSGIGPELAFVIGGNDTSDLPVDTTLIFDVTNKTWTSFYAFDLLPIPLGMATAALVDDTIFLAGGMNINGEAVHNTLSVDLSQSPLLAWQTSVAMPTARYGHGCAVVNGLIYCVGGHVLDGSSLAVTGAVEVFDAKAGRWTKRPALEEGRALPFTAAAPASHSGNSLFIIGGFNNKPENFFDEVIEMAP